MDGTRLISTTIPHSPSWAEHHPAPGLELAVPSATHPHGSPTPSPRVSGTQTKSSLEASDAGAGICATEPTNPRLRLLLSTSPAERHNGIRWERAWRGEATGQCQEAGSV
jgi:hypothetical protein